MTGMKICVIIHTESEEMQKNEVIRSFEKEIY
nr:MAG TPA: hypothetical protein [Caudoviricetes sp.]